MTGRVATKLRGKYIMNSKKNATALVLKRIKPRYIVIDENIHEALDLYTLSLYMAFRYESDYQEAESLIKRSAEFLFKKAKLSRRQFFLSLNILENFGLVIRDPQNELHSISTYHVARELNYFNTDCRGVHDMHGVVHHVHTDQYSLSTKENINTISDFEEPKPKTQKTVNMAEVTDAYHEVLPDSPKIRVIDTRLANQIKKMINNWPKYSSSGQEFTLQGFKDFLLAIKQHQPRFLLPYNTDKGKGHNNLRTITHETNLAKLINNEFNFK